MSERVGRWLSSLSAKYIAVFVLLVAVPAIGISVYLLDSSYNDNKAALIRLQQEKAKSVAVTIDQYFLDLTRANAGDAGPIPERSTHWARCFNPCSTTNATDAFYVDGAGHKTLATPGGGLHPGQGELLA